jgi:hypothetical protein
MVPTTTDVLLLPTFLTFFGVLIYGSAWLNFKRNGLLPKFRWWGLLPSALALLASLKQLTFVFDDFQKTAIIADGGRRVIAARYIAPVIPILLIAGIFVAEGMKKKGRLGDF